MFSSEAPAQSEVCKPTSSSCPNQHTMEELATCLFCGEEPIHETPKVVQESTGWHAWRASNDLEMSMCPGFDTWLAGTSEFLVQSR